jgi:hypothetical protein
MASATGDSPSRQKVGSVVFPEAAFGAPDTTANIPFLSRLAAVRWAFRWVASIMCAPAFEYSDCWVEDARLVVLNACDAADRPRRR